MSTWKRSAFYALLCVSAGVLQAQTTSIILKFSNLRPDAATVPAYVMFGGGGTIVGTNVVDNSPIVQGRAYPVNQLSAGVSLTKYDHGRIYLSLGAPLTTANASNGFSPNFANPSLPDFATRWDKIEIDLGTGDQGLAGGANLSAQDFFGIPLQIDSDGGRDTPAKLTWRESTANVFTSLGALSGYAVSTPQDATGAIGLGDYGVTIPKVNGSIVRVISPASVAPTGSSGQTVYASVANYIAYLQTGNRTKPGGPISTYINGHNGQIGKGGPFQAYDLVATISNSASMIDGTTIAAGDLVMLGTVDNGLGPLPLDVLVPKANLTDHAVFGANPGWTLLRGENMNSIVEKVVADYFAALNFGLAGSTVDNPMSPGTALGDSPSWTWYGNKPDGEGRQKLPITNAFAYAEPSNPDRYLQYASYLVSVSDAYGFAYNDRLQSPLASFTDGARVTISILPDTQPPSESQPAPGNLRSAATKTTDTPLAPGSISVVLGDLPVSSKVYAAGGNVPLPSELAGFRALFNELASPIFSAYPREALVQVPWELSGQTETAFHFEGQTKVSRSLPVKLARTAPGIFTLSGDGAGQGIIVDPSNRLVDQNNPAAPGSILVIYCTGLGPVLNQPATGAPAPASPLATTIFQPEVYFAGVAGTVLYSGLTPGQVGLYQINVVIPQGVTLGSAVPVGIEIDGVRSNLPTVAIKSDQ